MNNKIDLLPLLEYIDPASLDYQEWVNVGMALKEEGYTALDWDRWSQSDSRYREGECFRKWTTFNGTQTPVTGGTIYQMAVDRGYEPFIYRDGGHELDWGDEIKFDNDYKFIDKSWVEGKEIVEPKNWNPVQEITKYLETLFDSNDYVGYITETYEIEDKDGKFIYKPKSSGSFDRTAGELISRLSKCNGDIGAVLGDYKEQAGAYIRFNPFDGKGIKDSNVIDYRYALVESDKLELDKQNAIIRELELPVAALVHSGKKSIHAIVKIGAKDFKEYKSRVEYLYKICDKNGLNVDRQNKNPSRLSRMPGIIRNGKKQFLIDTNIGKESFEEWQEYIEELNDDLPEFESLADYENNIPELAPELINGVLRKGHKMLIAGPSKAGKSFALIGLSIAIAEGGKWFGWDCRQGKVLYINLELDKNSCINRFNDAYNTLGYSQKNWNNIKIWNLRGRTSPMDKLVPKLVRRAIKEQFSAVIIDPIYKVLTGDENSADQMAHFTNQFDKVATELECSVIYCHHHSKGSQGGKKSMDRASGSGVFARDPDALIDLVELEIPESLLEQQINDELVKFYQERIKTLNNEYYKTKIGIDDHLSAVQMKRHAEKSLSGYLLDIREQAKQIEIKVKQKTAWRVDGTLREFAKFDPVNVWFDFPIHKVDEVGVLKDVQPEGERPAWQKATEKRKEQAKNQKEQSLMEFELAIENCSMSEAPTKKELAEYLDISEKTVERRLEKSKNYWYDKNTKTIIKKKSTPKNNDND